MSSDDFYDVMFEVSNEERVKIMETLTQKKTSFSELARTLNITTQEVSRHFNRLVESGLATRSVEGHPCLTPYGLMLLGQLRAMRFTTHNREYFESHDATFLSEEFTSRLGELDGMHYTDDVMVAIHNCLRIIQEAEEYVLDINLPYISSGFPHIKSAYDRGVKGMFLRGSNLRVPDEMKPQREHILPDEYMSHVRMEGILQDRFLETDVILYMNEKEVALLSFPTLNGNYDYRGFTGKDPAAMKWCRDLFYHYWEQGTKQ